MPQKFQPDLALDFFECTCNPAIPPWAFEGVVGGAIFQGSSEERVDGLSSTRAPQTGGGARSAEWQTGGFAFVAESWVGREAETGSADNGLPQPLGRRGLARRVRRAMGNRAASVCKEDKW